MRKWYEKFHDKAFNLYNTTGEATAVHIVRDLAENVNTKGKWIDVVSMNTCNTRYDTLNFNRIIVELFPRITHPQYTNDPEFNKYICWKTAHNDIASHRSKNHHGEKYIVHFRLYFKEENRYSGKENLVDDYKVLDSHRI